MTAVKICGVCRPDDAAAAADAGADYIGVVLAPGYGRSRSPEAAAGIFGAADGVRRVGVFVDADLDALSAAGERFGLDVLQLHGGESPAIVKAAGRAGPWRVWKAVRPRGRADFVDALERYADVADALLLDGWSAHAAGGTGTRFPWQEVEAMRDAVPSGLGLIVAGGLTPETVGDAVRRLGPDVVDVSSGVERTTGVKDRARVRAFVERARAAARRDDEASAAVGRADAPERNPVEG